MFNLRSDFYVCTGDWNFSFKVIYLLLTVLFKSTYFVPVYLSTCNNSTLKCEFNFTVHDGSNSM